MLNQRGKQRWTALQFNTDSTIRKAALWRWPTVYFSGFLFGGVVDKMGVQDFRLEWLELINVGICDLTNKAISA